jgi:hypothetical protein
MNPQSNVALKIIDKHSIENLPSFIDTLTYQEALQHPHIIRQYDQQVSVEAWSLSHPVNQLRIEGPLLCVYGAMRGRRIVR